MRTILGTGANGELVAKVQTQLTTAGFGTGGIDGQYGGHTVQAVSAFQTEQGAPPTGMVDDGTWVALMNAPVPSVSERALQVTANIEGQGFTLAMGNFDGALLTWGIVGFTMKAGEVQKIILEVNQQNPASVTNAFGDHAAAVLSIMQDTAANQAVWAEANSLPNGTLSQPLRSMFAAFGSDPLVQAAQLAHVHSDYTIPAIATAKRYGLKSELGLALCLDCHVQNGGIHQSAAAEIAANSQPGIAEGDLLKIVATAVANAANPTWRTDVLKRKTMIATGSGTVHGVNYLLDNWGLNIGFPADELA